MSRKVLPLPEELIRIVREERERSGCNSKTAKSAYSFSSPRQKKEGSPWKVKKRSRWEHLTKQWGMILPRKWEFLSHSCFTQNRDERSFFYEGVAPNLRIVLSYSTLLLLGIDSHLGQSIGPPRRGGAANYFLHSTRSGFSKYCCLPLA